MEQRTCLACGEEFMPRSPNQRACSPTPDERARQKGQARGKCQRKVMNAQTRGRTIVVGKVGEPFDCAQCGAPCVPGSNVAPHASKFCGYDCKAAWHVEDEDGATRRSAKQRAHRDAADRMLSFAYREPTVADGAAYRRAMRSDPCAYCGGAAEASDHIVPRSTGGADDWTNRTGACHACNGRKMQTPLLTFLAWKRARDEFEPWRQIVAAIHTRAAA